MNKKLEMRICFFEDRGRKKASVLIAKYKDNKLCELKGRVCKVKCSNRLTKDIIWR